MTLNETPSGSSRWNQVFALLLFHLRQVLAVLLESSEDRTREISVLSTDACDAAEKCEERVVLRRVVRRVVQKPDSTGASPVGSAG